MRVLVLGASYTGRYLARYSGMQAGAARTDPERQVVEELGRVREVSFLTRHTEGVLARDPIRLWEQGWPVDLILDTVPALVDGRPAYHATVQKALSESNARYVHVSTTSVYPEASPAGSVDERTPPHPATPGVALRLQLEEAIREAYPGARILRSTGIYGPGRALPLSFLRGDFRRAETGNRIVSRIHVADLVRLALAMSRPDAPDLVNGVDEQPSENRATFSFLESLLGLQVPGAWDKGPPVGRAVRSLHARRLLGRYIYPTFREGFADVVSRARLDGTL